MYSIWLRPGESVLPADGSSNRQREKVAYWLVFSRRANLTYSLERRHLSRAKCLIRQQIAAQTDILPELGAGAAYGCFGLHLQTWCICLFLVDAHSAIALIDVVKSFTCRMRACAMAKAPIQTPLENAFLQLLSRSNQRNWNFRSYLSFEKISADPRFGRLNMSPPLPQAHPALGRCKGERLSLHVFIIPLPISALVQATLSPHRLSFLP